MHKYIWVFLFIALSLFKSKSVFSAQIENSTNQLHKILTSELKWVSDPSIPKEIQVAIVYGDPNKDGPHVMRIRMPAGSKIAPHWHPINENITVLSGSMYAGHGDKFDQKNSAYLPAGSFASIPAKNHHYAWVTEDTILQLNNFGRWQIIYVNPKDDPRNK